MHTEIKLSTSSVYLEIRQYWVLPVCRRLVASEATQFFQTNSAKTFDDSTDPDC